MNATSIRLIQPIADQIEATASRAVLAVKSPATRRNYHREITRFLALGRALDRPGVLGYIQGIKQAGNSPSAQNIALCAIKLLIREALVSRIIDESRAYPILDIRLTKPQGQKRGKWITDEQLQAVIAYAQSRIGQTRSRTKDNNGNIGVRDAAVIACIFGCGMRRDEVANLTWDRWQYVEGRAAWVDIIGKGDKRRTVPCSDWAAMLIERWRTESGEDRK